MAFSAASSMPVTQGAVRESGRRRLRPSLSTDAFALVQWASFRKIVWNQVATGRRIASSYFVHRGLASKDHLFLVLGSPSQVPTGSKQRLRAFFGPPEALTESAVEDCLVCAGVDSSWALRVLQSMGLMRRWTSVLARLDPEAVLAWMRETASDVVVVKNPRTNNALGVAFCDSSADSIARAIHCLTKESLATLTEEDGSAAASAGRAASQGEDGSAVDGSNMVIQRCFVEPVLLGPGGGETERSFKDDPLAPAKFTLRANVLAVGRASVYLHQDVLVHTSTEGWSPRDWGRLARHVSNHSLQQSQPGYSPAKHTLTLQELASQLAVGDRGLWQWRSSLEGGGDTYAPVEGGHDVVPRLLQQVSECVAALFARASAPQMHTEWLPQLGCFELFGIDFLPEHIDGEWHLRLLEVNEGPALGALARPDRCRAIVEDTWRVCVDSWLRPPDDVEPPSLDPPPSSTWPRPVPHTGFLQVLCLSSLGGSGVEYLSEGFLDHARAILARERETMSDG
jgi:hypothetical protein